MLLFKSKSYEVGVEHWQAQVGVLRSSVVDSSGWGVGVRLLDERCRACVYFLLMETARGASK